MEKSAFLDELKKLVETEEVLTVSRSVNELKHKFDDFLLEEERKAQVAQLEAGEEIESSNEPDPIKQEFYDIYRVFQLKRKDAADLKKAQQEENLRKKRALIGRLEALVKNEENIGAAFASYKEIHEEWKNTGDIPRDKRAEVQHDYSQLLETFFYQVKIYRELKEHDLHRNEQLKLELIDKLKALAEVNSIKETESQIKLLQNEWEEIGPVSDDKWEEIKTQYWEAVRAIYNKINVHYEARRGQLAENIEKKNALVSQAKELIQGTQGFKHSKEWEDRTADLLKIQEEWKTIGFGPKKENEEVWHEFRAVCDAFFADKKAFYDSLREESKVFVDAKKALIEKAKELKDSTDWKTTSDQLIRLQKEWKKIGHAGQRMEQRLWKEFRGACDVFFNNRQAHFAEKDKENEANLVLKNEIIAEINAYQPGADKQQVLKDLKEFSAKFSAIGHVPMKQKDSVYNAFKTALDKHYDQIKLEGKEKENMLFQAKLDTIKASPDAGRLMQKEKGDIRRQIDKLNQEILQYENNLGFFGNSKGADSLKKEVEQKINVHRRKIDELKQKLKQLSHE